MGITQNRYLDIVIITTTDEFLARERTEMITSLVTKLMAEGKSSRRRGWVMFIILAEVQAQPGKPALPYAREYLVRNVCGINKACQLGRPVR